MNNRNNMELFSNINDLHQQVDQVVTSLEETEAMFSDKKSHVENCEFLLGEVVRTYGTDEFEEVLNAIKGLLENAKT